MSVIGMIFQSSFVALQGEFLPNVQIGQFWCWGYILVVNHAEMPCWVLFSDLWIIFLFHFFPASNSTGQFLKCRVVEISYWCLKIFSIHSPQFLFLSVYVCTRVHKCCTLVKWLFQPYTIFVNICTCSLSLCCWTFHIMYKDPVVLHWVSRHLH